MSLCVCLFVYVITQMMSGKYKWQKGTVEKSESDSKKQERKKPWEKNTLRNSSFVTLADTSLLHYHYVHNSGMYL